MCTSWIKLFWLWLWLDSQESNRMWTAVWCWRCEASARSTVGPSCLALSWIGLACELDSLGKVHWALEWRHWWRPERPIWWSEPESLGTTTVTHRWAWCYFLWINVMEVVQKQNRIPPLYIHLKYIKFRVTATVDSMLNWVSTNVYFCRCRWNRHRHSCFSWWILEIKTDGFSQRFFDGGVGRDRRSPGPPLYVFPLSWLSVLGRQVRDRWVRGLVIAE